MGYYDVPGDNQSHGFLYGGTAYTTIDVPGEIETLAQGVNNTGQIVGWYRDVNGNDDGLLATPIIRDPAANGSEARGNSRRLASQFLQQVHERRFNDFWLSRICSNGVRTSSPWISPIIFCV